MSSIANLSLYLLTFNCGRALIKPEVFGSHFFDALPNNASQTQPPDLIVLNLQEIAPLADGFNGQSLPQYYDLFKAAVRLAVKQRFPDSTSGEGENGRTTYTDIMTQNAGLTAIMLFVRSELSDRIEDIMSAGVGVGVQQMGNKGAVGLRIAWRVADQPTDSAGVSEEIMNLTFVAAHLAPAEEAYERRNQDFHDIAAGLVFEPTKSKSRASSIQQSTQSGVRGENQPLLSTSSNTDLIGMYSPDAHVFFAGDLNYRTSNTAPAHSGSDTVLFPQPSSPPSSAQHYKALFERDQLTKQIQSGKTLHGLIEAPIDFPPTYKYSAAACAGKDVMLDNEVSEWKWAGHRWPSWCDRIFYSSPQVKVHNYTALPLFATSDHRPVGLSASIPVRPVLNQEFAARRPVELNPNWRTSRDAARFKEAVVGAVWYSVSTTDGVVNLTMGIAAVVCFAVLATVYAREW